MKPELGHYAEGHPVNSFLQPVNAPTLKCSNYMPCVLSNRACFATGAARRQTVVELRSVMCWPMSNINEWVRWNMAQWLACLRGPAQWHREDPLHEELSSPGQRTSLVRDDNRCLDQHQWVMYSPHCLCAIRVCYPSVTECDKHKCSICNALRVVSNVFSSSERRVGGNESQVAVWMLW